MVRGNLRWLDADRGNPGPFGSDPAGLFPGVNRVARGADTDRQASVSAHLPWGHVLEGRVQQRFQASVSDLENRYHDTFGDSIFRTRRLSARAQTDVVAGASTGLSFGVETLGERARSTYVTGETGGQVPIERGVTGVFAEVRQDVGRRASVTAGIRLESIRRAALEADPNPYGPRPAFPLDRVTSVNPRVATSVALWQDARGVVRTRLHASAGTGIRPPDAFEIAFTDNPSLAPERSRSVDAGLTHMITDRLEADVTVFHNRYDDLIVAVGSMADVSRFRTDNISNARARGLEVSASWRGRAGLLARTAYTWLDTSILAVDHSAVAPAPFTVGDPLVRRPRHQGSLSLEWAGGRLSAFGEARVRGAVLDLGAELRRVRRPLPGAGVLCRRRRRHDRRERERGGVRARAEPARPAVRRGARLSGARAIGDGGGEGCSPPVRSRSPTAPRGRAGPHRAWSTRCRSKSPEAHSWASSAPTAPARRRC